MDNEHQNKFDVHRNLSGRARIFWLWVFHVTLCTEAYGSKSMHRTGFRTRSGKEEQMKKTLYRYLLTAAVCLAFLLQAALPVLAERNTGFKDFYFYGPEVITGYHDLVVDSYGDGYYVESWDWGENYSGVFKQNRCYQLTINLCAEDGYSFDSQELYTFYYNDVNANAYPTYSDLIARGGTRYRKCQVGISFACTDPIAVTGLKAKTIGMNRVQLDWNDDEASDGYLILRGGRQIGFSRTNTFIDDTADSTAFNYFWVIPFSLQDGKVQKGLVGDYVYALGRTISKVTNLKAVSKTIGDKPGAQLTWNAAEGANYYVIYHRIGKTGSPSRIAETDQLQINLTGNAGELQFYWVYGAYADKNGNTLCAGPMSDYAWAVLPKN